MKNDLISRKALIDVLNTKPTIAQHMDCMDVFYAINETPTAYDVDKVVEQIKKLINANNSEEKTSCDGFECIANDCIECMVLHCISIVEGAVKYETGTTL